MTPATHIPNEQSLDDIVKPLLDTLNHKYSADGDVFEISVGGEHWIRDSEWDESIIRPPDCVATSERTIRAVATLMSRTGSYEMWNHELEAESDRCRKPLRFRLTKNALWYDAEWEWNYYLIVDTIQHRVDVEGAERQVALLVDYLSDESNLVPFDPELLNLF